MPSLHVALIEDEPSHAVLMEYHLQQLGIEVTLFTSGQSFVQSLPTLKPTLLLISDQLQDIELPTLIKQLETKHPQTLPLLITTTGQKREIRSDFFEIDYLCKPFSIHDFREAVRSIINRCSLVSIPV